MRSDFIEINGANIRTLMTHKGITVKDLVDRAQAMGSYRTTGSKFRDDLRKGRANALTVKVFRSFGIDVANGVLIESGSESQNGYVQETLPFENNENPEVNKPKAFSPKIEDEDLVDYIEDKSRESGISKTAFVMKVLNDHMQSGWSDVYSEENDKLYETLNQTFEVLDRAQAELKKIATQFYLYETSRAEKDEEEKK